MPLALLDPQRPAVEYGELSPLDAGALSHGLADADQRVLARVVRGSRARTESAFYDELSAALQLPDGFGANWMALTDTLRDFTIYSDASLVVIATEAEQLLADGPDPQALLALVDIFTTIDREAQEQGDGRARLLLAEAPGGLWRIKPRVEDLGVPVALAAFTR